jgi:hypothetical protein
LDQNDQLVLRECASAPAITFSAATPQEIAKIMEFIVATLPSKSLDLEGGKKKFAVYIRLLAGRTTDELSYLSRRACAEHDWFPTPRQCLEILKGYQVGISLNEQARRKLQDIASLHFDAFVEKLKNELCAQQWIDKFPEQWRRIAVEKGYLKLEDGWFIQRKSAINHGIPA